MFDNLNLKKKKQKYVWLYISCILFFKNKKYCQLLYKMQAFFKDLSSNGFYKQFKVLESFYYIKSYN